MASITEWIWQLRDRVSPGLRKVNRASDKAKRGMSDLSRTGTRGMAKMDKATDTLDKSIEELEDEMQDLQDAKRKAFSTDEIGRLNRKMDSTQGRIDKLNKAGRGRGSLKSSLTGAASSAGGLLGNVASLANPMTAAAAAGTAAAAAVGKFVANTVQAANEMNKLRNETQRLAQLSGGELDKATAKIAAVAKTFGKDQTEVLKTGNAMAKQMGISVDEALNNLKGGLLAGASQEFLQEIREYAPQFKAAGIEAGGMVSVLTKAQRLGIWTDKLPDAIKEAGLALREQTKPVQDAVQNAFGEAWADKLFKRIDDGSLNAGQALQKISQKAQEANLSVSKQQTLIADVFKAAGEDVGPQLFKVLSSLDDKTKELVESAGKQAEQKEKEFNVNKRIAKVQNRIGKITGPITKQLKLAWLNTKLWLTEALQPVFEAFQSIVSQAKSGSGLLSSIFRVLKLVAEVVWDRIKLAFQITFTVVKLIWNQLKLITFPLRKALGFVLDLVGGTTSMSDAFAKVQERIDTALRFIKAFLFVIQDQLRAVINNIADWLRKQFKQVVDWARGIFSDISNWVRGVFSDIAKWVRGVFDEIANQVRGVFNAIADWVRGVFGGIASSMRSVFQPVIDVIDNIIDKVSNFFSDIFSALESLGSSALQAIGVEIGKVSKRADELKAKADESKKKVDEKAKQNGQSGQGGQSGEQALGAGTQSAGLGGGGSVESTTPSAASFGGGGGETNITIKVESLAKFFVENDGSETIVTDEMVDDITERLLRILNNASGMARS